MQKVKLGEICEIINGFAFKSENYVSKGIRIIRITNVKNGFLEDLQPVYYPFENEEIKNFMLKTDDILISLTGNVGRVAKVSSDFLPAVLNQRVACLRLKQKIAYDINIAYIFYALNNYEFEKVCIKAAKGVAQKNLSTDWLKNYCIAIPNIDNQNNISKLFHFVNLIIYKRKTQIEKLDELVKSRFIEIFNIYDLSVQQTNWKKISSVAEIVGGSTPKTDNELFWGGDRCWITPAEINYDSFVIYDTERKLTEEGVKSCSLKLLPVGTVLLSSRAPIGKLAIAGVEMYCNQGFKNIICSAALNSVYVYYLLKYNSDYLVSLGRGATFKEISKEIVGNIAIPVPPIELQNKFAEFVEKVEKNKSAIKKSLSSLETLKKSLMQKYFG